MVDEENLEWQSVKRQFQGICVEQYHPTTTSGAYVQYSLVILETKDNRRILEGGGEERKSVQIITFKHSRAAC